ncbi:MAG: ATP-binding cassette domain-containing protein [Anaerolineae bacterium]|nr:ATP-binding cassette domain-containing protein [Anaerolineae bacterium]
MQPGTVNSVISVMGVSKRIGKRQILDEVDLEVPAGKIYGISGQNGAGKSMLLRVICGLVHPSQGTVSVFGEQIGKETEFPKETGALIDRPGFLLNYSGPRNLELLAMIRDVVTKHQISEALRLVGLDPHDGRPVRTYSTGMRQRLGIAQAIMEKPQLLLLDEPTNGVDREGVRELHQFFKGLKANGVTILLTSHSREELHELCDDAFLVEQGRLMSNPQHF